MCSGIKYNFFINSTGLSIRSVSWQEDKILVGTNAGEVFEVIATNKDKPRTIVQVPSRCTRVHVHMPSYFTPENSKVEF